MMSDFESTVSIFLAAMFFWLCYCQFLIRELSEERSELIKSLRNKLNELDGISPKRIDEIEKASIMRIGDICLSSMWNGIDHRKKITAIKAIEMILLHLGLNVEVSPEKKASFELVKVPKKK